MIRSNLIACLFALIASSVHGQLPGESVLSNLPASIRWQQIKSRHFRIIFPEGAEKDAQKTANILEHIHGPASQTLGVRPRRFPIVLQNRLATSNGFVTIAPYRSELFTMAPQHYNSLGNDDWLEHLISHEYRHMVQFERAVTPFIRTMYGFFGELVAGAFASVAVPAWFFEGDAVGLETAMGRTGRGRQPAFTMAYKANLIDKGGFNYYKQHLNSFRDFVPNHYVTGYLMTTHLKNEFDPNIWGRITRTAFRLPYVPFTFSRSIKKETNMGLVKSYQHMMEKQESLYNNQLAEIDASPFQIINSDNRLFTTYRYPRTMINDKILTLKVGLGDISQFVLIDSQGKEETIHIPGVFVNTGYLSSNDSVVVWIEQEFDPRWQNRTYSVIKKLNTVTKKAERISIKTRYSAATISPDSKQIVATHQGENSEHSLHLIDANTGQLIKVFDNPENSFYSMPSFDPAGKQIIVLKHINEGKEIILKSINDGAEEIIFFSKDENMGNPVATDKHIFYNSNYNGIDNIWAIDRSDGKSYMVTQSKFGAFNADLSSDGAELVYNDYTAEGMQAVGTAIETSYWTPRDQVKFIGTGFEDKMVANENIGNVLYNAPDDRYPVQKYNKLLHAVRPVSWGPYLFSEGSLLGLGFRSQDVLSTTALTAAATFNTAEDSWRQLVNLSYQGLFPIIDIGADVGLRAARQLDPELDSTVAFYWDESTYYLGLRIPLHLTNSAFFREASFSSQIGYSEVSDYTPIEPIIEQHAEGTLISLMHHFSFTRILRRSKRDIGPRWGQTLDIDLKHVVGNSELSSTLFGTEVGAYFPGLSKHHSVLLRASWQYEDSDGYNFISPVTYTRGYGYTAFRTYTNLSFNYKLPLAHMDFHIGPVLNIQRIYANTFFDYGFGQSKEEKTFHLPSIGTELSFNFNIMRFQPLLDVGIRLSHLPTKNKQVIQLVIGGVSF